MATEEASEQNNKGAKSKNQFLITLPAFGITFKM
jgi:hypothetical protein